MRLLLSSFTGISRHFFYVYIFNLREKTYKLYQVEVVIILRYTLHVSERSLCIMNAYTYTGTMKCDELCDLLLWRKSATHVFGMEEFDPKQTGVTFYIN